MRGTQLSRHCIYHCAYLSLLVRCLSTPLLYFMLWQLCLLVFHQGPCVLRRPLFWLPLVMDECFQETQRPVYSNGPSNGPPVGLVSFADPLEDQSIPRYLPPGAAELGNGQPATGQLPHAAVSDPVKPQRLYRRRTAIHQNTAVRSWSSLMQYISCGLDKLDLAGCGFVSIKTTVKYGIVRVHGRYC